MPKATDKKSGQPFKTFEDSIDTINRELEKRRGKWQLQSLTWLDYDDVSQIIRLHIYQKWHLYDQSRPLEPWLAAVISSQTKNLVRNIYSNLSPPCKNCAANEGNNLCSIYGTQCNSCPLYAKWEKHKKSAYDSKLPLSMVNHENEVYEIPTDFIDIESAIGKMHGKMCNVLKPLELKIYRMLYIEHLSEEEVAKKMNYKTTEKGRKHGYKHLTNIRKSIFAKAKQLIYNDEIDILGN